jgi:hypothetical protein
MRRLAAFWRGSTRCSPFDEMLTIAEFGISGKLARYLATTILIELPNSLTRRGRGRTPDHGRTRRNRF